MPRAIDGKMGPVHDPPEPHEFEQRLRPPGDGMKIAIDGYPLAPPRAGIGQYTYHLIRRLSLGWSPSTNTSSRTRD